MKKQTESPATEAPATNFIRAIVEEDLRSGRYPQGVITRFPPEPNGYLHIGHAKAIVLNFGIAQDYRGLCNLRFDDTNPETEDVEYVESIQRDVRWLGYDWDERLYYASDYFERLYEFAEELIRKGRAYVDSQTEEEIRQNRGTVTEPGRLSPYRDRSVDENLDLFRRMRAGEFPDGAHVLRAKGDMASTNMKMRDPLLYRIRHAHHYRTGDDWCIYPMYDYAHPLSDALENITHSLCTLEFDNNREVYDWVLDNLFPEPRPHQYEFARLNLEYTVLSKRRLLTLVKDGHVSGWDDPRMPTIAAMRRRGITPEAIRDFCERIGVAKANSRVDVSLFEHSIRDDLNYRAPRVMCVLRPLKVVITNYPESDVEWLDASYWPHDIPKEGKRKVPFSRELFIEQDDFMENPPKRYHRLSPGQEVRLRYGYLIRCDEVIKDASGGVVELRCTYDPETRGGNAPDGRKVRGTIHWVSASHALPCEVRLYDRLFNVPDPEGGEKSFIEHLNPESLVVVADARVEPSIASDPEDTRYQFERQGYFWRDPVDSTAERLVFNRIISLRDSWAKIEAGESAVDRGSEIVDRGQETVNRGPEGGGRGSWIVSRESGTVVDPMERLSEEARRTAVKYQETFGVSRDDSIILAENPDVAAFFESAVAEGGNAQSVANWVVNELLRDLKTIPLEKLRFGPRELARLADLVDRGTINSRGAKDVYSEMLERGGDPEAIVKDRGLAQVSDESALDPIVRKVVEANPEKAAAYRKGKTGLIGFFVGQVMRETGGRSNPELVKQLLERVLARD